MAELSDFSLQGVLGQGEFGTVMMAIKHDTQKVYAIKVLRKDNIVHRGGRAVDHAVTEKQVLQDMSMNGGHPFIVSLHFAFQDVGHLYLVLDFVGGGDLYSLLEARHQLPEHWVQVYAGELVLALLHVHSLGIIFRDLKPENVMVEMDGHLKLTDFGLAKIKDRNSVTRASICGTPAGLKRAGRLAWPQRPVGPPGLPVGTPAHPAAQPGPPRRPRRRRPPRLRARS